LVCQHGAGAAKIDMAAARGTRLRPLRLATGRIGAVLTAFVISCTTQVRVDVF
jgi:hypothetical protein